MKCSSARARLEAKRRDECGRVMGRRKLIEVKPNFFIEPVPVDDTACARDLNDPMGAFAQYLLPRLKNANDEASKEVLALVKAGEGLGEAVAMTIQSLPTQKTKKLRAWTDEALSSNVYAYTQIQPSRGYEPPFLVVGLLLTEGGPRDKILQHSRVKQERASNYAPYRRARQAADDAIDKLDVQWIRDTQREGRDRAPRFRGQRVA